MRRGRKWGAKQAGEVEREGRRGFLLWRLESDKGANGVPAMTVPLENAGYASGVALMGQRGDAVACPGGGILCDWTRRLDTEPRWRIRGGWEGGARGRERQPC